MFTGRRCGGTPARSAPFSVTRPLSGVSKPAMQRISVVLPHPMGRAARRIPLPRPRATRRRAPRPRHISSRLDDAKAAARSPAALAAKQRAPVAHASCRVAGMSSRSRCASPSTRKRLDLRARQRPGRAVDVLDSRRAPAKSRAARRRARRTTPAPAPRRAARVSGRACKV